MLEVFGSVIVTILNLLFFIAIFWAAMKFGQFLNGKFSYLNLNQVRKPTPAKKGDFARPSVTATMIISKIVDSKYYVLLGKRSDKSDAYPGAWSLPGGFLNAKDDRTGYPGEETRDTASRETKEEIGLDVHPSQWELVEVYSNPTTDPRCHVVNVGYYVQISEDEAAKVKASDDLSKAEWMELTEALTQPLAFNHSDILKDSTIYMR